MKKLHDIIIDILTNPDSISVGGKKFEEYFEGLLKTDGFTRVIFDKKPNINKIKELILLDDVPNRLDIKMYNNPTPTILHNDSYIHQPFGSQSYPDFLIAESGMMLGVELKSVDKGSTKPMWNGSLPRQHGLYIFLTLATKKQKEDVTIFTGWHVISNDQYLKQKEYFSTKDNDVLEFNDELGKDNKVERETNPGRDRGFIIRPRAAYDQSGKAANYFKHECRGWTEKSTLKHIQNL